MILYYLRTTLCTSFMRINFNIKVTTPCSREVVLSAMLQRRSESYLSGETDGQLAQYAAMSDLTDLSSQSRALVNRSRRPPCKPTSVVWKQNGGGGRQNRRDQNNSRQRVM